RATTSIDRPWAGSSTPSPAASLAPGGVTPQATTPSLTPAPSLRSGRTTPLLHHRPAPPTLARLRTATPRRRTLRLLHNTTATQRPAPLQRSGTAQHFLHPGHTHATGGPTRGGREHQHHLSAPGAYAGLCSRVPFVQLDDGPAGPNLLRAAAPVDRLHCSTPSREPSAPASTTPHHFAHPDALAG